MNITKRLRVNAWVMDGWRHWSFGVQVSAVWGGEILLQWWLGPLAFALVLDVGKFK